MCEIKLHQTFVFYIWISLITIPSQAHRNGGPIEACRTLVPDHEGMEPLDGASSNYYLEVEPQDDGSIEVVLAGGTFKGILFLVQSVLCLDIHLNESQT